MIMIYLCSFEIHKQKPCHYIYCNGMVYLSILNDTFYKVGEYINGEFNFFKMKGLSTVENDYLNNFIYPDNLVMIDSSTNANERTIILQNLIFENIINNI